MTDKELKKLSRRDLLEIMLAQEEEIIRLTDALSEANEQLQNRALLMKEAGSMAEAALRLNGVFAAADAAAAQYLESVKAMHGEAQKEACV